MMLFSKKELKETLAKELDFINEGNNSKRCFNELKHLGFVYVPKVYDQFSTKVRLCFSLCEHKKNNKNKFILIENINNGIYTWSQNKRC